MDPISQLHEAEEVEEDDVEGGPFKKGNIIKPWGNKESMNMNSMILTNILSSPYYKNHLNDLSTYHEVIDEIYYRVQHLEPWEKGSRKIGGQTGMCGGVRGVGAGGIVSTPFCLLYKLFTLKLTRSQLRGMMDHSDSPYIRALGFLYIRYSVPPEEFWAWFSPYLDDEEECDAKAGGGCTMTLGEMAEKVMTKLDWFSTLFPRIPVPIQKKIDLRMREYRAAKLKNESDDRLISAMMQNKEQSVATVAASADVASSGPTEARRDGSRDRDREKHRKRRRSSSPSSPSRRRSHSGKRSHKKHKKHHRHHHKRDKDEERQHRHS